MILHTSPTPAGANWLLRVLLSLSCGAFLFGVITPSLPEATSLFRHWGFTSITISVVIWFWQVFPAIGLLFVDRFRQREVWLLLLFSTLLVACMCVSIQPAWRVLADETNLLGTSWAMYNFHEAFLPTEAICPAHHEPIIISRTWDKRPLLFPYLVFLAHSLLGYSPGHVFIINAGAAIGSLFFLGLFLRRLSFEMAILAIVLLASYPQFLWCTRSGGFEIVNLCCGLLILLMFDRMIRNPTAEKAEAVLWTGLLFAQVRYESAVVAILFSAGAIWLLPLEERRRLRTAVSVFPLLWLPIVWQRLGHFDTGSFDVRPWSRVLDLQLFFANLKLNVWYFSGLMPWHGTLAGVFFPALLSIPLTLYAVGSGQIERPTRLLLYFLLAASGSTGFILCTLPGEFGNFGTAVTMRKGLVFLPILVAFTVYLVHRLFSMRTRLSALLWVLATLQLLYSWPIAVRNEAIGQLLKFREFANFMPFLCSRRDVLPLLVVTSTPNLYVPFQVNAISHRTAMSSATRLRDMQNGAVFGDILVTQRFNRLSGLPASETVFPALSDSEPRIRLPLSTREFLSVTTWVP